MSHRILRRAVTRPALAQLTARSTSAHPGETANGVNHLPAYEREIGGNAEEVRSRIEHIGGEDRDVGGHAGAEGAALVLVEGEPGAA